MQLQEFEVEGIGRVVARVQGSGEFSQTVTIPKGCTSQGMPEAVAEAIITALTPQLSDHAIFVPVEFRQNSARGMIWRNGEIRSCETGGLQGSYVTVYRKKA